MQNKALYERTKEQIKAFCTEMTRTTLICCKMNGCIRAVNVHVCTHSLTAHTHTHTHKE